MTFFVGSPTELQIMTAIQSWMLFVLPSMDINHVLESGDNGVPVPVGDHVYITRLNRASLSTPWQTYADTKSAATESTTTNMSIEYTYQLDCYGPNAADNLTVLHTLLRSDVTSEWFEAYDDANGITLDTFSASDPTRTATTNEENQYEERWTLRFKLDVVMSVSTPMAFVDSVKVVPVDINTLH